MNLWADGTRLVDRRHRGVDDLRASGRTGTGLGMRTAGRWITKGVTTSEDPGSSTIHMAYYRPCKNYIPL